MNDAHAQPFTWSFLDTVALWSIGVLFAVAAAGFAVTREAAFAIGCLLSGGLDIGLVHLSVRFARTGAEAGGVSHKAGTAFVAGRLALKVLLLLVAWALPAVLSFPGTVAGVLVYDVTLALVGSVVAVRRSFGSGTEGRMGDGGAA